MRKTFVATLAVAATLFGAGCGTNPDSSVNPAVAGPVLPTSTPLSGPPVGGVRPTLVPIPFVN